MAVEIFTRTEFEAALKSWHFSYLGVMQKNHVSVGGEGIMKHYALNSTREVTAAVAKRQNMERTVISAFVRSCLKAGYNLSVDNEELVVRHSTSYKEIMAGLFSVDEEHIIVYDGTKRLGKVWCVYGNDGWDVLADWSISLDELGLMKKAEEVIERLQS